MKQKSLEYEIPEEYERMFDSFLKESDLEEETSELEELAEEFGEYTVDAEGQTPQRLWRELVKTLERAINLVSQLQQTGEPETGFHQQDIKDLQSIANALRALVPQLEGIITRFKKRSPKP